MVGYLVGLVGFASHERFACRRVVCLVERLLGSLVLFVRYFVAPLFCRVADLVGVVRALLR